MENSVESTAVLPPKVTETNAQAGEVKKATELEGKTQLRTKVHRSSPSSSSGKNTTSANSVQQKTEPKKELGQGNDAAAAAAAAGGEEKKLTPAEMKKKAKEEKTARRAKAKELQQAAIEGAVHGGPGALGTGDSAKKGQQVGVAKEGGPGQKGGQRQGAGLGRRGSMVAGGLTSGAAAAADLKKKEDKNVAVFGHLYGTQRRSTIAGAGKEVHPAVLALGLQIRDYVICGSSARCVATLLAFKRVIESYTTPLGTSLSRHLTTHLSHQITYLSTCRPLSISQGNAIRALKLFISSIDPSVPEDKAKESLCDFIDSFIREKITVADQVIASSAAQKIQNGDIIVTFAGSSIVKQTLLTAHREGKNFRVSIIDSRPLFEGKNLARALANAGLEVQYSLIHGISHAVKDATKVFLGAHAMTGNGRLYSRVGTALVAMSAKERSGGVEIPVIVCCETVKFTDRVALDSIVVNELADADELVPTHPSQQVTEIPDPQSDEQGQGIKGIGSKNPKKASPVSIAESLKSLSLSQQTPSSLEKWKGTPNLQLLNIMYDVTPAEYVDMIVTEMGSLPPSAVPVVHRMSTNS